MASFSTRMFAVAVVLVGLWVSTDAVCCPWVLTKDVKCQCADGSYVHPWQCCSNDWCNVFCCNCGGPCKQNSTGTDDHGLGKRSVRFLVDHIAKTAEHFASIDADGDMRISYEEALAVLGPAASGAASVDADGDGLISPHEFDADIDDETVRRFAAPGSLRGRD